MDTSNGSNSGSGPSEIQMEGIVSKVRNLINRNDIKLWSDPYYCAETGPSEGKLLELSLALHTELELGEMVVFDALVQLQSNALERLEDRQAFKSSGKIALKLKSKSADGARVTVKTEVEADAMGKDLLAHAAPLVGADSPSVLKAIFKGRVLEESALLTSQGVKPGDPIMIARIDPKDESLLRAQEQRDYLERTRADAETLGKVDDEDSRLGLEITNQNGEKLALPAGEQKSLIMAMSLDEKGRACIKRGDFELGLVMLLEASHEYKNCRSDILEASDNYAVLNIEIAWCYLVLGQLTHLPDAESRLDESGRILRKIHGANLERVQQVKGNAANERVLYMRLHLLQGVVAFHKGDMKVAAYRLGQAKVEMEQLQIPEDSLEEVIAQGYSKKEAILGLRVSGGSVAGAVRHAQSMREDRERMREANAKREKMGKTINGNWVNLGKVKSLQSMGFHDDLIVTALRNTDNDLNEAIDMIQNRPDMLEMTMATEAAERSQLAAERKAARGFDDPGQGPSNAQKKEEIKEAYKRMKEDIGEVDEYLGVTMEKEEEFLEKYLKFVETS